MILCVKTADQVAHLTLISDTNQYDFEWEGDRQMAAGLLAQTELFLFDHAATWKDITGIVLFKGPGSFTGLRIGLTTFNAAAYSLSIPIVGVSDDDWIEKGIQRLRQNESDRVVMPEYGAEPRITKPRK